MSLIVRVCLHRGERLPYVTTTTRLTWSLLIILTSTESMVRVDSKLAISRWKREDRFLLRAYDYVLIPFLGLNNLLEEITSSYGVWNQRISTAASHWPTGRRHIGSPGCQERVDVKRKLYLRKRKGSAAWETTRKSQIGLYIPRIKASLSIKSLLLNNFEEKHKQVIQSTANNFTF